MQINFSLAMVFFSPDLKYGSAVAFGLVVLNIAVAGGVALYVLRLQTIRFFMTPEDSQFFSPVAHTKDDAPATCCSQAMRPFLCLCEGFCRSYRNFRYHQYLLYAIITSVICFALSVLLCFALGSDWQGWAVVTMAAVNAVLALIITFLFVKACRHYSVVRRQRAFTFSALAVQQRPRDVAVVTPEPNNGPNFDDALEEEEAEDGPQRREETQQEMKVFSVQSQPSFL